MKTQVVPDYKDCAHGCKETIEIFSGKKIQVPVQAKIDPRVYHFLNTREPYMIRNCPKCKQSSLVIIRD